MKSSATLLIILLLAPSVVFGKQLEIEHRRPSCLPSEQSPYITAIVRSEGTPRLYFRKRGTSDWCSVDGVKTREVATFVLPSFEKNLEIEYYIATISDDGRITGRSPVLYRVTTSDTCNNAVARHVGLVITACSEGGPGDIGTALGAGYMMQEGKSAEISPSVPPVALGKQ